MKLYGFQQELSKILQLLNSSKNTPILLNSDGYHFGKTTLSKYAIREFFSSNFDNPEVSYKKFDNQNEVDFLLVEPNEKGKLTLEHVEEIRDFMLSKPIQNPYKVVMIDEIHSFNTVSQNALLKTLEEPPSFVRFIFTTSVLNNVLDTIQSRSVLLPVYHNKEEAIQSYLYDNFKDVNEEHKQIILQYADSIHSLHLFVDEEIGFINMINDAFEYFTSIPNEKNFKVFNNHLLQDDNLSIRLDVIQKILFDVLYNKLNIHKYIINQHKIDEIRDLSTHTTDTKLIKSIEYIKKYSPYFKVKSIKQDLIINNIVLHLIQCFR